MTLRFGSLRVPTTVHWPRVTTAWLTLVFSDELAPTDPWVQSSVVIALPGRHPGWLELATLHWAGEHADELGADRDRLLVAGGARAAMLAVAARDAGWPVLRRQLVVRPEFTTPQRMPVQVAGAPPAIVVCGDRDDGSRYAARLRAAGVEVQEVRDGDHG
ncbi:MAG: alpha/beta hydrolase [Solirubrobacteraceae bacterium]